MVDLVRAGRSPNELAREFEPGKVLQEALHVSRE